MPRVNDTSAVGRMARKMELLMERYESGELIEEAAGEGDIPVRVVLIVPTTIAAVVSEFVDFYAD